MKKALILSVIIIILEFVLIALVYKQLPEQIPTHWNIMGEVDGYGSRISIFILPVVTSVATLWLYLMPRFVPKGENIKKSGNAYPVLIAVLNLMLAFIFLLTIVTALKLTTATGGLIPISVGILITCIGNYLPKIKPNYSFGIRLPWTLANETVWVKTHRIGGKVFFVIGLLFIAGTCLSAPYNLMIPLGGLVVGLMAISIYAYSEYKRLDL